MTLFRALSLALALAACGGPAADPATVATERDPSFVAVSAGIPSLSSVADLVEHLSPTVVTITTVSKSDGRATPFDFFAPQGPRTRQGAGTGPRWTTTVAPTSATGDVASTRNPAPRSMP